MSAAYCVQTYCILETPGILLSTVLLDVNSSVNDAWEGSDSTVCTYKSMFWDISERMTLMLHPLASDCDFQAYYW